MIAHYAIAEKHLMIVMLFHLPALGAAGIIFRPSQQLFVM
jgi:hypothetical protein